MNQTRLVSVIETTLNTASGYVVSFMVWPLVGPLFGYEVTLSANFWITNIFTVVSLVRSYIWRRFFNAGLHAAVVGWVTGRAQ